MSRFETVIFAVAIVALIGAALITEDARAGKPMGATILRELDIYLDIETGCFYLARPSGAFTPRLTSDGKPMCQAPR